MFALVEKQISYTEAPNILSLERPLQTWTPKPKDQY